MAGEETLKPDQARNELISSLQERYGKPNQPGSWQRERQLIGSNTLAAARFKQNPNRVTALVFASLEPEITAGKLTMEEAEKLAEEVVKLRQECKLPIGADIPSEERGKVDVWGFVKAALTTLRPLPQPEKTIDVKSVKPGPTPASPITKSTKLVETPVTLSSLPSVANKEEIYYSGYLNQPTDYNLNLGRINVSDWQRKTPFVVDKNNGEIIISAGQVECRVNHNIITVHHGRLDCRSNQGNIIIKSTPFVGEIFSSQQHSIIVFQPTDIEALTDQGSFWLSGDHHQVTYQSSLEFPWRRAIMFRNPNTTVTINDLNPISEYNYEQQNLFILAAIPDPSWVKTDSPLPSGCFQFDFQNRHFLTVTAQSPAGNEAIAVFELIATPDKPKPEIRFLGGDRREQIDKLNKSLQKETGIDNFKLPKTRHIFMGIVKPERAVVSAHLTNDIAYAKLIQEHNPTSDIVPNELSPIINQLRNEGIIFDGQLYKIPLENYLIGKGMSAHVFLLFPEDSQFQPMAIKIALPSSENKTVLGADEFNNYRGNVASEPRSTRRGLQGPPYNPFGDEAVYFPYLKEEALRYLMIDGVSFKAVINPYIQGVSGRNILQTIELDDSLTLEDRIKLRSAVYARLLDAVYSIFGDQLPGDPQPDNLIYRPIGFCSYIDLSSGDFPQQSLAKEGHGLDYFSLMIARNFIFSSLGDFLPDDLINYMNNLINTKNSVYGDGFIRVASFGNHSDEVKAKDLTIKIQQSPYLPDNLKSLLIKCFTMSYQTPEELRSDLINIANNQTLAIKKT